MCADKIKRGKPSPVILRKVMRKLGVTSAQTIYVGDMAIDVYAGRNAGIKAVAVRGGSSSLAELKRSRPFMIISKISGILNLV